MPCGKRSKAGAAEGTAGRVGFTAQFVAAVPSQRDSREHPASEHAARAGLGGGSEWSSRPVVTGRWRSTMSPSSRRVPRAATIAVAIVAVAACASLRAPAALPAGTPITEARHAHGGPSGEYALANGGTRLEFRQGT